MPPPLIIADLPPSYRGRADKEQPQLAAMPAMAAAECNQSHLQVFQSFDADAKASGPPPTSPLSAAAAAPLAALSPALPLAHSPAHAPSPSSVQPVSAVGSFELKRAFAQISGHVPQQAAYPKQKWPKVGSDGVVGCGGVTTDSECEGHDVDGIAAGITAAASAAASSLSGGGCASERGAACKRTSRVGSIEDLEATRSRM